MKQIYNKETKVSDVIGENQTIPEGWTDKAPNWIEFEVWDESDNCWSVSDALKTKAENIVKIQVAKQYLSDTDYKIIKELETGEVCPDEIKTKRAECRALINKLEA